MRGGELGAAQAVAQREQRGEDDRDQYAWPGDARGDADGDEDACAEDRAEAQEHGVKDAQFALESAGLGRGIGHLHSFGFTTEAQRTRRKAG